MPSYRPIGRIVLRRIGDDQLLVPVSGDTARSNCLYPVNDTGAFIWESLTRGKSLPETALEVSRAFEVAPEQAETDCREFVEELIKEGLLESAT